MPNVVRQNKNQKSAISYEVARANHVIDFENPKILVYEYSKKSRDIKEAIEIGK